MIFGYEKDILLEINYTLEMSSEYVLPLNRCCIKMLKKSKRTKALLSK